MPRIQTPLGVRSSIVRSRVLLSRTLLVVPFALAILSCDGGSAGTDRGGPFEAVKTDAAAGDAAAKDGGSGDVSSDAAADARDGGGTDGKADAAATGDAKADAPAGSGTGGMGGSAVAGSGGANGGGGTSGTVYPSCAECEQTYCQFQHQTFLRPNEIGLDGDYFGLCHNVKDAAGNDRKAAGGPAMGSLKKDLCEAVLNCVHNDAAKCVTVGAASAGGEDISGCYFGTPAGVMDGCTDMTPTGACKMQMEAAAEVTSDKSACGDFSNNVVDWQTYAIGAAAGLINSCDVQFCRVSCLHLPGPNRLTGDGADGAAGGASGNGGNRAAGGATGTGGVSGVGGMTTSATGGRTGTGGIGGSAAGSTGGASGGTGGSAVTYNMCRSCEQSMCPESSCDLITGSAAAGPAKDSARKDLCLALVACVRAKKCSVEGDTSACYCGTAEPGGACMAGSANGPCKAQMEAAAESVDPAVVTGERFTNPDPFHKGPYALGWANDLIGCDAFNCGGDTGVCGVGDPVAAGTGGKGGSGGVTGTGGGMGTGGVAGMGGVSGTGGMAGTGGAGGTGGTVTGATLVNPGFDTGMFPWAAEYAMGISWLGTKDAAGSNTSGSLAVTNGNVAEIDGTTMGGARQCLSVTGAVTYAWSTQVFIPTGQGTGSAGLNALFYPTADCSGAVNGTLTSTLASATNAWTTLQGTSLAPAEAHSVAVRLVIVKAFRAPSFQANFDNVMFKRQ